MSGLFDDFMVHTVGLITMTMGEDASGAPEPTPNPPIEVKGMMLPLDSRESIALGLSVVTTYRFTTTAEWLGKASSEVIWGSRRFNQFGSAQVSSMGWDLDHTRVILTEIAPEVS
jgi:hypothetical protein